MNILYLATGTGGLFLEDRCIRDAVIVAGLRDAGHRVLVASVFFPFETDEQGTFDKPHEDIFLGAFNVWAGQRWRWLAGLPVFLRRPLDSASLLQWAAARSLIFSRETIEETSLECLKGEEGLHASLMRYMIRKLGKVGRPDAVILSTATLLGLASPLRHSLKAPIICFLQDEIRQIDEMSETGGSRVLELLSRKAADADILIAPSRSEAEIACQRLGLNADRLRVVTPGIRTEDFGKESLPVRPQIVGYAARLCDAQGLGVLVEAVIKLKTNRPLLRSLHLRATGGYALEDVEFVNDLSARLSELGMKRDFEALPDFSRQGRLDLMHGLSVFSLPVPRGIAWGIIVLEAMAAGVPVVEPETGGVAAVVSESGGGLVYDPTDLNQYAEALGRLLENPDEALRMGRAGRKYVLENCTVERCVVELTSALEQAASAGQGEAKKP